jgi:uncharacterized protein
MRACISLVVLALGLLLPSLAWAFTAPPMQGHVTDLTRTLDEGQRAILDGQMEGTNKTSPVVIAVLVVPSLSGEPIENVAGETYRAWKLGKNDVDNGALLLISMGDKRMRIEVGKDIQGVITDEEKIGILSQKVGPRLSQGHLYEAIQVGVNAISEASVGPNTFTPQSVTDPKRKGMSAANAFAIFGVAVFVFGGGFLYLILRFGRRLRFSIGGFSIGIGDNDSTGSWGGGGGGTGGGGGDSSGGGGSSDSS